MSQTSPHTTHELSCPNCGAPYAVPDFGNQVTCHYCGTRFLIPESAHAANTNSLAGIQSIDINLPQSQVNVARWVKWLVIFIVITTVVPVVCGVGASVCGALAPLGVFLFK